LESHFPETVIASVSQRSNLLKLADRVGKKRLAMTNFQFLAVRTPIILGKHFRAIYWPVAINSPLFDDCTI
jgi:hypothetical protein